MTKQQDLLWPSVREGANKRRILDFIINASDESSPGFIPPEERIACFDNDGTLWAEQPLPSQIFFAFDHIKSLAKDNPDWASEQPFKAVIENDNAKIRTFGMKEAAQIVGKAHATVNVDKQEAMFLDFVKNQKHPVLTDRTYLQLIYYPPLELIALLKAHGFRVYIVSGGSIEFVRAFAPQTYGIAKEFTVGSTFVTRVVENNGKITIEQTESFEFNDDREGKIINIHKFIGKIPALVIGNSDGDMAMMKYADMRKGPNLNVYFVHDDAEREWDYSVGVGYGALIEGEKVARERDWILMSMKNEWKQIFVD